MQNDVQRTFVMQFVVCADSLPLTAWKETVMHEYV